MPSHPQRDRHPRPRRRALAHEPLERRDLCAGDVYTPLVGDWNGDGRDSLGLFSAASGQFYLRDINAPGFPHRVVKPLAIPAGSLPIAGDWDGDGRDSPGVFDAVGGHAILYQADGNVYRTDNVSGAAGDVPIAGDFDADGRDDVALYHPTTKTLTAYYGGAAHDSVFGVPDGVSVDVIAGDFDGHGLDKVALVDRAAGQLYFADQPALNIDLPDDAAESLALAGDWGGHGRATLGWFRQDTGIFTPWHTWAKDPLAAPLFAVPSSNVQSHVDLVGLEPWHNAQTTMDVDGDRLITPVDAVLVLNALNTFGPRSLPDFRPASAASNGFLDTSGDAFLSPLDALLVINRLNSGSPPNSEPMPPAAAFPQLSAAEVTTLLDRASAASASRDAIIAVVDRGGRILGVRVENDVLVNFSGNTAGLVFAIDGAVAKARTAAFFSSNQAPLTSRTVRFISQSTVTQREVQSNPNLGDLSSPWQGPGFVAPIGVGGHFPPGVNFTPPVDLFGIEHSNRDSLIHPGADGLKGTADDIALASRFNIDTAYIPLGQELDAPESYGYASHRFDDAQSRGIATLPGGIPLYRDTNGDDVGDYLIGGIGVFFPGPNGYADYEQGFVQGVGQTELGRTNAPRVLEAEWMAFAAAGGFVDSQFPGAKIEAIDGIPRPANLRLPFGRIDLVGITLEIYGPNPTAQNPVPGPTRLLQVGAAVMPGGGVSGAIQPLVVGADTLDGEAVPEGWLVLPHGSGALSTADVERIIMQGISEASLVRAAIRLPIGQRTKMVFSVSDLDGNVLGLYRMPDATYFSIDVAVAKSRNEAYYADPNAILPVDRVDDNRDGVPDASVPASVALTARTFRFLAEPRYPAGIDGTTPGAFSMLRDPGINPNTAENTGVSLPASAYTTTLGFDAFHAGRNFHDPSNIANQNGVVFFPGSAPLYVSGTIAGGFGVSGDGVDQDDVVTAAGYVGFATPQSLRADEYFVRGVRLPYMKFLRNPHG
jgi:uncharacterized protein GlcG (DUF336 family)